MATSVFEKLEIELENGETVVVKPLTIANLRKFMEVTQKLNTIETENEAMEIMVEAGMVCFESCKPELSKDKKAFENAVNLPTLMKVLEVCGGLKMNDPNLLGATLVGTN